MNRRLILSQRARADIDEIWEFSAAHWTPAQADRYLTGLDDIMHLLCQEPGLARLRHEFHPPVRMHPYKSHVIMYRSDVATMDVIRILHARSDWRAYLAE